MGEEFFDEGLKRVLEIGKREKALVQQTNCLS